MFAVVKRGGIVAVIGLVGTLGCGTQLLETDAPPLKGLRQAQAASTTHTLTDGNATADFDVGSQAGMRSWTVNGINHLSQQWFWYRIGGSGPEHSVDALDLVTHGTTDTNFDGDPDTLFVLYRDPAGTFEVAIKYRLTGGTQTSPISSMLEVIEVDNTGTSSLDLHFFQYCDFELSGTLEDQSVVISGGNTASQEDVGFGISEAVVAPRPSRVEVNTASNIVDALNDGTATTLSGAVGPSGPGDLTWAFQWDTTVSPGDSFLISKVKSLEGPPPIVHREGCTPGYWKQRQHLDSWRNYSPDDLFDVVFDVDAPGDKTLLEALKQGGGGYKALGRHAVAALLDAANPDVNYAFSVDEVIAIVQDAFATGDFEAAKDLLEEQNELGCPLN